MKKLSGMKLRLQTQPLLAGLLFLFLPSLILAQEGRLLSGTVTDVANGESLPGVSVFVKSNPESGTVTDFEGKYELRVEPGASTLVFSFVGYTTLEKSIGGLSVLNVEMAEGSELIDEVVVTALGVEKDEKAIGYAASEVKGETLVESRENNVVNALSGKVAGVQVTSTSGTPGASANIVIRGRSSINNNSPLFVIDGIPIDNNYSGSNFVDYANRAVDINPEDIESMTVLKGAAATALYGLRAANGAIVITTKRGRSAKPQISFTQSVLFDQVNKLPEQQQRFAQGEVVNGVPVYRAPGESNLSWGPLIDTLRYDGNSDYPYSSLGGIVGQSDSAATSRRVEPFNNPDEFFRTGISSTTNLSISGQGPNNKYNYYFSGGYAYQSGIIPNSDFRRLSFKASGEYRPLNVLKIGLTANYVNNASDRPQRGSNLSGVMLGLTRTPATFDLTNGLQDPADNPAAYALNDSTQRTYWPAYDNPYWSVNRNRSENQVDRVLGRLELEWQISSWLKAIYRIGGDYYRETRLTYWDNASNEFGTGVIFDDSSRYYSINSDFLLTANKKMGSNWDLTATLGHNFFDEDEALYISEGETFVEPGVYTLENVSAVTRLNELRPYRRRIIGAYYDAQLGYRNFLYLNISGRMDWSSTLPVESNPFFYDSYSLSMVFSELLSPAITSFLSFGKLRLSYATVGGDASPFSTGNYFAPTTPVRGQSGFLPSTTIGSVNLIPEFSRSWEAGLDLRLFQNRLGIDFTYYTVESLDQIIDAPIVYSTGFSFVTTNAGRVENEGVELLLSATPVKRKDFQWDVSVNFTRNRNIVKELAPGVEDIRFSVAGVSSTSNRALPGQPFGVLYGTRWLRNADGDILINDEGYPLQDTMLGIVGDPNPDWLMGVNNVFRYKNLSLSFLWDIRQGGDIYNGTVGVMQTLGIHKSTENREEEVVIEGVYEAGAMVEGEDVSGQANRTPVRLDQDYYRGQGYPFAGVSEAAVEDGSWVRLRQLSLNYRFPKKWLENNPLGSFEIGFSARNLLLFTDYTGVDPETNLAGASNSFGRDYFNSPNTRSFGLNLKAVF
jgi:TonB-linked SusC/RagA family outer membrane protein